uniref:Uncharacterized protein n=1 Tax=Anolis carolinensis TaxID=28377 RepID=A0A803TLV1_ANOCA
MLLHNCQAAFTTSFQIKSLNFLARQQTRFHNIIYQNQLALDYLLAAEGEVFGKFSLSNCCLEVDDKGDVTTEITNKLKTLAHIPI